jgi:ribosomal-protein-alanine N-acetyltransferase
MSQETNFRNAPRCPFGNLKWNRYYWEYKRQTSVYEEEYWGKVKDPDGQLRDMLSSGEKGKQIEDLKPIIDRLNCLSGGKLLDVGCGPGFLLSAINSQWEKYGVDVSAVALEQAKAFAKVQKGEFPYLAYPSEYFDAVVMNHVIEHLRDPVLYVQECLKVLKPGGIFIIATPDFDSGCARHFGKNYRMLCDKGHISLFTTASLIKMLEDLKFMILEIEYPFFEQRWFTKENLLRMFDSSKISPPFYGNHILVVASKPAGKLSLPKLEAPFLKGDRISLVKLDGRFINDMFEYSSNPAFYAHMELSPVKTIEEMRKYLDKIFDRVNQGNAIYWVIILNDTNKMIGTFAVAEIDMNAQRAEVGYGLSPDYWRSGYFKEALSLVMKHCFKTIGLNRLQALTMSGNLGSIRGLEQAGFRREGVLRKYYQKADGTRHDAELFGILRDEFVSPERKKNG